MKRINPHTVQLTSAETVVKEWFDALLDSGLSIPDAAWEIEQSVPTDGETLAILNDPDFRGWLLG